MEIPRENPSLDRFGIARPVAGVAFRGSGGDRGLGWFLGVLGWFFDGLRWCSFMEMASEESDLVERLVEVGKRLLNPPSDVGELLALLDVNPNLFAG